MSTTPTGSAGLGGAPVVARWGTGNPTAPLVVALHGRGASENSMIELAPWLPHGPVAFAAVRAPVKDGSGFVWYDPGDDAAPDSLATSMAWFLDWLGAEGDPDRPVILLGYSNGAAFAAALMLSEPHRWAGGVLLNGALPFDVGLPVTPGRLTGIPVYVANGVDDTVIPPRLQQGTWEYLITSSGAPVRAEHAPGGHELAGSIVGDVGAWLGERLAYLRHHGENPLPDGEDQHWPTVAGGRLPARSGQTPEISTAIPQQQKSQNSPAELTARLSEELTLLPGVRTEPSALPDSPAQAFVLGRTDTGGSDEAFILPDIGEFAHLHPDSGTLHTVLPDALAYDALAKGWAVPHPLAGVRFSAGTVMVFGPRDTEELDIVAGILAAAHSYAKG